MNATAEASAVTLSQIPDDLAANKARVVKTILGNVTVKSLTIGGLTKISALLRKVGIKTVPMTTGVMAFLTPEQRNALGQTEGYLEQARMLAHFAELLTPEQKAELKRAAQERLDGIVHWIMASEQLLPAAICAVTELSEEEALNLRPADVFNVLGGAIDLIDVPATMEAAIGFFTRIGGLMDEYSQKKAATEAPSSAGG